MTTKLKATLAEITEREQKATKGPWTTEKPPRDSEGWPTGACITTGVYAYPPGGTFPSADKDFIAHARTDIPKLVAIVEHLMETITLSNDIHQGQRGHYLKQRSEELEEMLTK